MLLVWLVVWQNDLCGNPGVKGHLFKRGNLKLEGSKPDFLAQKHFEQMRAQQAGYVAVKGGYKCFSQPMSNKSIFILPLI